MPWAIPAAQAGASTAERPDPTDKEQPANVEEWERRREGPASLQLSAAQGRQAVGAAPWTVPGGAVGAGLQPGWPVGQHQGALPHALPAAAHQGGPGAWHDEPLSWN